MHLAYTSCTPPVPTFRQPMLRRGFGKTSGNTALVWRVFLHKASDSGKAEGGHDPPRDDKHPPPPPHQLAPRPPILGRCPSPCLAQINQRHHKVGGIGEGETAGRLAVLAAKKGLPQRYESMGAFLRSTVRHSPVSDWHMCPMLAYIRRPDCPRLSNRPAGHGRTFRAADRCYIPR